jgi:hypothetical protein
VTETTLSISAVTLYGQKVSDMIFLDPKPEDPGNPPPVKCFIRVFGFGFEGAYYSLDAPIIMLLEGEGTVPGDNTPKDVKNSYSSEIKQWVCDKSDLSARMDELTGTIEDILLEVELGGGGGGRVSGGRVSGGRVSGGRVSGGKGD